MGQAKRNQQRHCPALDEIITPATCGSNRNNSISCTADCPHNPFSPANYLGSYQEIEAKVFNSLSRMLYDELDFAEKQRIRNAFTNEDQFLTNFLHVWHLHGERRTEKWRERGAFRNWKNDELVVVRSLDAIRVALLEVQCVLDDRSTLVRDLLSPDQAPFVLLDASNASKACRFTVLLTWIYQMPGGFWRISGIAVDIPRTSSHPPLEMFETVTAHLGAPETDREAWLLENMPMIHGAIQATATAQEARRYERSDLTTCERIARVDDATLRKLTAALRASPRILDDGTDSSKATFHGSLMDSPLSDESATICIGNIAVFSDGRIKLTSLGKLHTQALLDFIQNLAPRLEITSEDIQDLGRQKRDSLPHWEAKLVPPALLEQVSTIDLRSQRIPSNEPPSMRVMMKNQYENFADTSIPALEDHSPRDAANDPRLRPILIELMKLHITGIDRQRRSEGLDFDLNPLLEDLGLLEIIQPPPPCGKIAEEDDDEYDEVIMPEPQFLIEGDELDHRMDMVMADRGLLEIASKQIHELLTAMHDLGLDLNDLEIQKLQVAACLAQALIHPTLPEDFFPDPDSMIARTESFLREFLEMNPRDSVDDIMERMEKSTRQQEVLEMCFATFHERKRILKKSKEPRQGMLLPMSAALCACVCEITLWPPSHQ